jgi:hypothetical protein
MKAAPPESLYGASSDYRSGAQHFREGKDAADKLEFGPAELGSAILAAFKLPVKTIELTFNDEVTSPPLRLRMYTTPGEEIL